MGTRSNQVFDQYASAFSQARSWADRHLPRGTCVFDSILAFITTFSVLVFVVETFEQVAGLSLPFQVHLAVYLIPSAFALAGWRYSRLTPSAK